MAFALPLLLYVALAGSRVWLEIQAGAIKGGSSSSFISSRFDPRNIEKVDQASLARESDAFKNRLQAGTQGMFFWPGLKSLQVSVTWLHLLQGVHNPSSYEGDFSWVFSKLDTIARATPAEESTLLVALAPFYFLMNKDGAGGVYLMNSMVNRNSGNWRVWFWAGFHALENLREFRLAGDMFKQASLLAGAPNYLAPLSLRLSRSQVYEKFVPTREMIEAELPQSMVEKIKKARPEWMK